LVLATDQGQEKLSYPKTPRKEVYYNYHGFEIYDPYQWLEDDNSPQTQLWTKQQNKLTQEYLAKIEPRENIKEDLTKLWDYPKYTVPEKCGNYYFFQKNDGLQNQPVLYQLNDLKGEPEVLLNPNTLCADGTIALAGTSFSRDGSLLAYSLSRHGSDWQEIWIRRTSTKENYPEVIQWCRFSKAAWLPTQEGFYYARYPEPNTVPEEDRVNYCRVYLHKVGTDQKEDSLIYERSDQKELGFDPFVTEDGKYLLLYVYHGTDPENRMYYRSLEGDGQIIRLLDEADARYVFMGNVGTIFYFHTTLQAARGRIVAIDINHPERDHWQEILPERQEVIESAQLVNQHLVVTYLKDVQNQIHIFDLTGAFQKEIPMPCPGTVAWLSGKQNDPELFFSFTSFLYPPTIYTYDFRKDSLTVFRRPEVDLDASAYEIHQVFYNSKDGTQIPMFIVHRKNIQQNENNPTLLYAYGGFGVSLLPWFSVSTIEWLKMGGVYAVANIRGGGEYGEDWHRAGMLQNRQNVFDDFIGAAKWLIENQYTRPSRLAIQGGSNGGLLVAACMEQKPELFGAVICEVPVTDMLKYHKFSVGRYWTGEFGNAEKEPEHFRFLRAYSPLHNVEPDKNCPPILVTTADTDDRVMPAHARKFIATLQEVSKGEAPALLRVEMNAGHGHGQPTSKRIEKTADVLAFLYKMLEMDTK